VPGNFEVPILGDGAGQCCSWGANATSARCSARYQNSIDKRGARPGRNATNEIQLRGAAAGGAPRIDRGAGTVEFLVDANDQHGEFFFLEVMHASRVNIPVTNRSSARHRRVRRSHRRGEGLAGAALQHAGVLSPQFRVNAEDPARESAPRHPGVVR